LTTRPGIYRPNMFCPLYDISHGRCVPEQCVPTLTKDRKPAALLRSEHCFVILMNARQLATLSIEQIMGQRISETMHGASTYGDAQSHHLFKMGCVQYMYIQTWSQTLNSQAKWEAFNTLYSVLSIYSSELEFLNNLWGLGTE
jgi:hypothetical protein